MTPADVTEAEWIGRVIANDDRSAFTQLVRLHQAPIRRFLGRLCAGDWARADDLAQETFWKAYRHIGSYRSKGRFQSWLFSIAWQLFVTQQRRHRHVVHETLIEDWLAAEDTHARMIDQHTFDQLLRVLRDKERAAGLLHYHHGLTHEEVAATLQLPLGTAKTLIRRARQKLQQAFDPNAEGETS